MSIMSKVLIVYGSTTGNTQSIAERVKEKVEGAGHEVVLKNAMESTTDDLQGYDIYLFGSSTWNDGELQDDLVELHMQLEDEPPTLTGSRFASFGCGESVYEKFCAAVDILDEAFEKWGSTKIVEGLKIDGYPEEDVNVQKVEAWTTELISKL